MNSMSNGRGGRQSFRADKGLAAWHAQLVQAVCKEADASAAASTIVAQLRAVPADREVISISVRVSQLPVATSQAGAQDQASGLPSAHAGKRLIASDSSLCRTGSWQWTRALLQWDAPKSSDAGIPSMPHAMLDLAQGLIPPCGVHGPGSPDAR